MLSRIDAHSAVGSPCDSVKWLMNNRIMILAARERANKGEIIVCFGDNNNQLRSSNYLREQIRKILKNLAPKLALTPPRRYD